MIVFEKQISAGDILKRSIIAASRRGIPQLDGGKTCSVRFSRAAL
jgi:hypothetical protein